jgi:hypothetical protein
MYILAQFVMGATIFITVSLWVFTEKPTAAKVNSDNGCFMCGMWHMIEEKTKLN